MSCNVVMPISDIVKEVKKQLNLNEYAKTNDSVANNLTLKGGLTIDGATKADLCDALQGCLGNEIKTFNLAGETLTISMTDGTIFPVDLSKFVTDQETQSLADALQAQIKDDFLATAVLRGTQLHMTMNSGLTRTVDLSELAKDSTVGGMVMDGTTLVVNLTDGTQQRIDLNRFANPAPVLPVTSGGVTGTGASNNHIRLNLGNGLKLTPDGKLTLDLGSGLTIKDGNVIIDDDGICTQTVKAVDNYTALPTDEILLSSGGTITFPANIPVGKSYTVIQTGDSEVKLVGHPNIHSVGGTTTLKGKNHAVTVIRGTSSDWFVYGGVRP